MFKIVVQKWRVLSDLEQQAMLADDKCVKIIRNILAKVDLPICRGSFQIADDLRCVMIHLLTDFD